MKLKNQILSAALLLYIGSASFGEGLLAEWNFDEGQGEVARDSSGNGHDLKFNGASWAKHDEGFAVSFDGVAASMECDDKPGLNLSGPVSIEAWVHPNATGWGECHLIGKSDSDYMLNYSNRGMTWWLVNSGSYNIGGKLDLGRWNHVVATFDGKQRSMWINGLFVMSADATPPAGNSGKFTLGTTSGPCFNGLLDRVRVYNRALSPDEAIASYRQDAAGYGVDPVRFQTILARPFYYFDQNNVVVEADYRGLVPLTKDARIEVSLAGADDTAPIASKTVESLPASGMVDVEMPCENLVPGKYVINVTLREADKVDRVAERISFDYPSPLSVPAPSQRIVEAVQPKPAPAPFEVQPTLGGGFALVVNGVSYPFESRVSWPNGEFNHLSAGDKPAAGESSWKIEVQTIDKTHHQVTATGEFYTIQRTIKVLPTHVLVNDTYTNRTDQDLGLIIYNEHPLKDRELTSSRLAGYEGGGRIVDGMNPHYGGASIFVQDENAGIGMLPLDDVYVLQSVLYLEKDLAGMGTEKLALGPKGNYTLEWAIYPHGKSAGGQPGDYWDFINTFRRSQDRISPIEGGASFISFGPMNRRQIPSEDHVANRGIKVGIISCLSRSADDPGISLEGIEFIDFPKEMQLLKQQAAALHQRYPGMKVVFHNAHTLYATNNPERYADSKIITKDGAHAGSGGPGVYFSQKAIDEGWLWYVYYPTPGNSFHDAMMKSVDVMMDEMGLDGVFVDGFLMGYGGRWTYDRWDGYSAEIDPKTKTIQRKIGSVLLLMQPSMIEYSRKIRDKGGVVIANGSVITRSIANEKYIIFDAECQAGPECHLAPNAMALSLPPFSNEKEIYFDVLDKLRWGVLYVYYNERIHLTYPSLPTRSYPITFEEMRSGLVRGKERIITMNSGTYAWPGDDNLHAVYCFDGRGAPTANRFITTVDRYGVRTELAFDAHESAVIQRIPATIAAETPVNVLTRHYDGARLNMVLNGKGKATLEYFVGTSYPDKRDGVLTDGGTNPGAAGVGDAYDVRVGGASQRIEERDGTLTVPLELNGQIEIEITPAKIR